MVGGRNEAIELAEQVAELRQRVADALQQTTGRHMVGVAEAAAAAAGGRAVGVVVTRGGGGEVALLLLSLRLLWTCCGRGGV